MRFGAALLSAASVLVTRLVPGLAERSETPTIEKTPLALGEPIEVSDLQPYETRCFLAPVAIHSKRVRVLASVVALSGNPSLRGGWKPVIPGDEPDKDAGFEILDKTFEKEGSDYYLCLRTFSAQGCDVVLTALVTHPDEDELPRITMRHQYPSIWPLGTRDGKPEKLHFSWDAGSDDFRLSALPLDGDTKVRVFKDPECDGKPIFSSEIEGPGVLSFPQGEHEGKVCIEAEGDGVLSLTVTGAEGSDPPLLAPSVPAVVELQPHKDRCQQAALILHEGVNTTITARAEDGSPLKLEAFLEESRHKLDNRFKSKDVPGGEGAVLMVSGAEMAHALTVVEGRQGKATLRVNVCRNGEGSHSEKGEALPTLVWLDAVTDRTVVTLADGLDFNTVVPAHTTEDAKAHFRDFRFLVPGGKAKPKEITITASSPGKACIVADTHRFPHDPEAYRWTSREQNTSEPVIRLTTDITLRSDEVHYIDCRFPCFIYITALAWTTNRPDRDTDLEVLVTMEERKPIMLMENAPWEMHLAERETQKFAYQVSKPEQPVLFTLSTIEGQATVRACVTPDCKELPATTGASDSILLGPNDHVLLSAIQKAGEEEKPTEPVIYLQVTSGNMPATFTLVGRATGDEEVLHNGEPARGAVEAGGYDHYKFYIGEEEVEQARKQNPDHQLEVSIQLSPVMGTAGVFVSTSETTDHPDEEHYDFKGGFIGENSIFFTSMSPEFRPGWFHVGIPGKFKAAYGIRVAWGNATIQLQDGMEELGKVMDKEVRTFTLVIEDRQYEDQPVVIRLMTLVGSISLCVKKYTDEWRQDKEATTVCDYKAVAEPLIQSKYMNMGLAALDIPPDAVRKGGRFVLLVQGLKPMNVFSLRATVDAPATLAEGHDVVDSIAPACCMSGPGFTQLLKHRYVAFVRPVKSAALWVRAMTEGNLAGMLLKAREHGEKEGYRSWPFQNHSDDDTPSAQMQLDMDLKELTVTGGSFWLEIEVEAVRPVNFTMHLVALDNEEEVQGAQQQLLPGEVMSAVSVKDEPTLYEFALDRKASDGVWHLQVRECLGHISFTLPYAEYTGVRKGDAVVPLPPPEHRNSGSINADGIVVVQPESSEKPVKYELLLMMPGTENSSPILPPAKPTLTQESRLGKFEFNSAHVNRERLKKMIGPSNDAELFYTLVAVPANDSMANFNSSCGLTEAAKRPHALSVKLEQRKTIGKKRLSAELPEVKGGAFVVNVMVSLISDTGQILASSSYTPYYFNASATFGTAEALLQEADTSPKMALAIVVMGCVACCWCMTSSNSPCGSAKGGGSLGMKAMEEDSYELQDTFDGTSLLSSRAGNYVPPNV